MNQLQNTTAMNRLATLVLILVTVEATGLAALLMTHIAYFYPWALTIRVGTNTWLNIRSIALAVSALALLAIDLILGWILSRVFTGRGQISG